MISTFMIAMTGLSILIVAAFILMGATWAFLFGYTYLFYGSDYMMNDMALIEIIKQLIL